MLSAKQRPFCLGLNMLTKSRNAMRAKGAVLKLGIHNKIRTNVCRVQWRIGVNWQNSSNFLMIFWSNCRGYCGWTYKLYKLLNEYLISMLTSACQDLLLLWAWHWRLRFGYWNTEPSLMRLPRRYTNLRYDRRLTLDQYVCVLGLSIRKTYAKKTHWDCTVHSNVSNLVFHISTDDFYFLFICSVINSVDNPDDVDSYSSVFRVTS